MTFPLRCKGSPSVASLGLLTLAVIVFWVPIIFFAYKAEDGDIFRKCIAKIIVLQLVVPFCAYAFSITRPSALTLVTGICIGLARLAVSLSRLPAVMAFIETFGSFARFTDISVHSQAGVVFFQLSAESFWMYSFILLGFLPNIFVAHCGVDWVFVGGLAGAFVGVFETVGSHGGLTRWTLHFVSTFVFTHCTGIMTGAYFALCLSRILAPGFYMCSLIVPWMTLLFGLMVRYLLGFWGPIVAPVIVGAWTLIMLVPVLLVRGE